MYLNIPLNLRYGFIIILYYRLFDYFNLLSKYRLGWINCKKLDGFKIVRNGNVSLLDLSLFLMLDIIDVIMGGCNMILLME